MLYVQVTAWAAVGRSRHSHTPLLTQAMTIQPHCFCIFDRNIMQNSLSSLVSGTWNGLKDVRALYVTQTARDLLHRLRHRHEMQHFMPDIYQRAMLCSWLSPTICTHMRLLLRPLRGWPCSASRC